jgi:hypothetical protein
MDARLDRLERAVRALTRVMEALVHTEVVRAHDPWATALRAALREVHEALDGAPPSPDGVPPPAAAEKRRRWGFR